MGHELLHALGLGSIASAPDLAGSDPLGIGVAPIGLSSSQGLTITIQ
jgi:hypothetical protein